MITLDRFVPYYVLGMALLLLANVVWAFRDARQRGQSGVLIALLVLCVPFPLGVLLWLIFRPAIAVPLNPSADVDADLKARANAGLL